MAKSFAELRAKLPQKLQAQIKAKTIELSREMTLNELRKARMLTQENLADRLNSKQSQISQIEKKTDMYLSTLKSYICAMGGELKLIVEFPDGTYIPIRKVQSI